jgi:chromosome segregation ATPase
MSSKKSDKKLKKLKQRLDKAQKEQLSLLQKTKKLADQLKEREQQIGILQGQLECLSDVRSPRSSKGPTKPKRESGIQRQDWKRFSYLRDRYEYHLGSQSKQKARVSANQDLVRTFGVDSGYSEDELDCILS